MIREHQRKREQTADIPDEKKKRNIKFIIIFFYLIGASNGGKKINEKKRFKEKPTENNTDTCT